MGTWTDVFQTLGAGYVSLTYMARVSLPGPEHEHFITWAKNQGVKISGVGPAKIPGRGLGIIAQRRIEVSGPQAQLHLSLG